jgi:uncharacterized protein YfcZ (UPF0381/DUF406 family)
MPWVVRAHPKPIYEPIYEPIYQLTHTLYCKPTRKPYAFQGSGEGVRIYASFTYACTPEILIYPLLYETFME